MSHPLSRALLRSWIVVLLLWLPVVVKAHQVQMCRCETQYEDLYNRRLAAASVLDDKPPFERSSSSSSTLLLRRASVVEDAIQSAVYEYLDAAPAADGYYYNSLTGVRILPKTDPTCVARQQSSTTLTAPNSVLIGYANLFANRRGLRQHQSHHQDEEMEHSQATNHVERPKVRRVCMWKWSKLL
jgi:hypothetical protein